MILPQRNMMTHDEIDFSHLTDEVDIDDEKMEKAIEVLDDACVLCEDAPTMHDATDLPWCDEHSYRCEFINYGHAHNWPKLACDQYALSEGSWFWVNIAMLGTEDCLLSLAAATVDYEKEGV